MRRNNFYEKLISTVVYTNTAWNDSSNDEKLQKMSPMATCIANIGHHLEDVIFKTKLTKNVTQSGLNNSNINFS